VTVDVIPRRNGAKEKIGAALPMRRSDRRLLARMTTES
jgi:hypothetical protein